MTKTWQSMLAVLAVAGATLLGGAPPVLAQVGGGGGAPDPTTASTPERVSAEVLPAVMYVQVDVLAVMRNLNTNQYFPIPGFALSCTGFAVAPNGVVATAGHCLNEQDLLEEVADQWALEDTALGYDYQQMFDFYRQNYKLEGQLGGSPPDRTVTVSPATSSGSPGDAAMPAQIVDQKSSAQGDVALLKVDATNLPTVEVAPSDTVNTGTAIMSVGYPAARDAVVDPTKAPSWKDGSVSSRQNRGGVPVLEITSDMGAGMSGGPTVNQQGQVVGINSGGVNDAGDTFNFVAPSSLLLDMMARNGLRSEPGPVDIAYRTGLDQYFSGQYSDAAEEFQRVLDQQPENKLASEYRVKALSAYNEFGDKGSLGLVGWLLVGGGAVGVLVVGSTLILVPRVRRRRAGPDAPEASPSTEPFAGPLGGTGVPAPRNGDDHLPTSTLPFGAAPFSGSAPQSPPIGFPRPTSDSVGSDGGGAVTTAALPSTIDGGVSRAASTSTSAGFCPHCGTARVPGARFCGNCGLEA